MSRSAEARRLTPREAVGFAGLVDRPLDAPGAREVVLRRAAACGYRGVGDEEVVR